MKYFEKYNFYDTLLPHGEDGVAYEYSKGNLLVNIPYDSEQKKIRLIFEGCEYQYFSLVPGFLPEQLSLGFNFKSSCVYELFDSEILVGSEEIYKNTNYQPNRRHFFLYLEWANVSFQVLSQSFEYLLDDQD